MSLLIPNKESKGYSVNLATDLFGNLARVRSMDFNRPGYMMLARKPNVLYTETQNANFESPLAIVGDDDDLYVVTSEGTFRIDPSLTKLTVTEMNGGTPPSGGFQGDGCFFNGELHVTDTSSIHSLTSSTWAEDYTGLSSSYPHPLCVSEHQQYLAVGNGNSVRLLSTAYALITTLTLPSDHVVTWIRWRANLLWIGTRNIQGGEGKVYLWNGSGTAAQSGYGVGGEWAFSGCVYDIESTIVVASSTGQLLKFGGSGFIPLRDDAGNEMAFPIYHTGFAWGTSAATLNLRGRISSRGMEARGRRIYMNVDSGFVRPNGGIPGYLPNFPGGLWCFDPKVGLYHKGGVDHKQIATVTCASLASNTLTLSSAQVFETGDPVQVVTVGSLTGDVATKIYYAIKVSSTEIKLAATPQQAVAGDNITITGAVTSAELVFHVYESVGAHLSSSSGGLFVLKGMTASRFLFSEVVYGMDVDNTAGTTIGSVMSFGVGKNVGSFVTPKMQASAVTDTFDQLVAKFGDINIGTRKILVKYRTKKRWGLPGRRDWGTGTTATWVTSTTFTINPKAYDMYSVEVGDEIEFLDRAGGGYTAHITAITVDSATQWTITIDETMPDVAAAEATNIIIDNWTKLATISTTDDAKAAYEGLKKLAVGGENEDDINKAKWIELKFEMRGYTDIEESMDFEEVMLSNTPDQNYA